MKKILFSTFLLSITMSFVFAQDAPKKCDCDPALWKTTNKSDNAVYASYFKTEKERGKYLTHFEFSENNKEGKNFECVLNSAFTYRFNVYLSDKSAKKATLQLFILNRIIKIT